MPRELPDVPSPLLSWISAGTTSDADIGAASGQPSKDKGKDNDKDKDKDKGKGKGKGGPDKYTDLSSPIVMVDLDPYTTKMLAPEQARALVLGLRDARVRVLWHFPMSGAGGGAVSARLTELAARCMRATTGFQLRFDAFPPETSSALRLAVLGNSKVAALITTATLGVVQEALWWGKPVLTMPITAEQHDVSLHLVDLGVAVEVDLLRFGDDATGGGSGSGGGSGGVANRTNTTAGSILGFGGPGPKSGSRKGADSRATSGRQQVTAAVEVLLLDTSTYAEAQKLGRLLREAGGVGVAADLVEAAEARATLAELTDGRDPLGPKGGDLPWYMAMLLDVYAVYAVVLCGMAVILRTVWSFLWAGITQGISVNAGGGANALFQTTL